MGQLADDTTRLCDAIRVLRSSREASRGSREVSFRSLKDGVARLRASFRNAHAQMARKTKADCLVSVSNVRKSVSNMRKEVSRLRKELSTDLAGAHKAWFVKGARRYR